VTYPIDDKYIDALTVYGSERVFVG
jgi:hypothetical protein